MNIFINNNSLVLVFLDIANANLFVIIFASGILKKIKVIFIHNYLYCCEITKDIGPTVPISVNTSITLKLHRLALYQIKLE